MRICKSSASSTSLTCCPVDVPITLVPNGCGIEFCDGIAYSVGKQCVDVCFSDPCNAISAIFLNGKKPPVIVPDGCPINISVIPNPNYVECGKKVQCFKKCTHVNASNTPTSTTAPVFMLKRNQKIAKLVKKRMKIIKE